MTEPSRGISPVIGTVVLLLVVVSLTAVVGTTAFSAISPGDGSGLTTPGGDAAIAMSVTNDSNRITLHLERGSPIDVRELTLRIDVDGAPLEHQPTVPAAGMEGFYMPTGPFNEASDPMWTAGESATLRVAGSNDPPIELESEVTVTIYRDGHSIATVRDRAT